METTGETPSKQGSGHCPGRRVGGVRRERSHSVVRVSRSLERVEGECLVTRVNPIGDKDLVRTECPSSHVTDRIWTTLSTPITGFTGSRIYSPFCPSCNSSLRATHTVCVYTNRELLTFDNDTLSHILFCQ